MFYTNNLQKIYWKYSSPKSKLKTLISWVYSRARKIDPIDLRSTDVIISPEFQFAEAIEGFSDLPIAVFVQNPFSLMTSYHRALDRGLDPQRRVKFWFGIAEVCRSHLSALELEPSAIFPVSMKPHEFPYASEKEKLITYMPRKRPWEAKLIADALTRRGKLHGYRIEALDNMPRSEVAAKLAKTRVFISLLKDEALGFPAAEAMAAGCVVVGFDGLGTAEYFDNDVGVPVTEGDVASLVTAVENTIAEYEADPERLDSMRRTASDRVNDRYNKSAFEAGTLAAWQKFEETLDKSG